MLGFLGVLVLLLMIGRRNKLSSDLPSFVFEEVMVTPVV